MPSSLYGWLLEKYCMHLRPAYMVGSILDIDFDNLPIPGPIYAIIDADGTLLRGDRESEDVPLVIEYHLKRSGLETRLVRFVVLSNTIVRDPRRITRIQSLGARFGAKTYCCNNRERKPRPIGYKKALELLGPEATAENTIVIGDQLFTDIWGGRSLCFLTIYVKSLGGDHLWTVPKRWFESLVLWLFDRARFKKIRNAAIPKNPINEEGMRSFLELWQTLVKK